MRRHTFPAVVLLLLGCIYADLAVGQRLESPPEHIAEVAAHAVPRDGLTRVAAIGRIEPGEGVIRVAGPPRPVVDGSGTRSALLVPVKDSAGAVFLVIQARATRTHAFGSSERDELETLSSSLGVLLESWWRMGCACRGRGVGAMFDCCR